MAIKQRVVFQSIIIEYSGQPKVSFSVDGTEKLAESTLPNHPVRQTRRFYLPVGCSGYTGQLFINPEFKDIVDYQIESSPEEKFRSNILYHYYDVSFTGTISLKISLDEQALRVNNGTITEVKFEPRDNKTQDNRKIFFPQLSYGYIPHIQQSIKSTETGQVLSAVPVAMPPQFTKGLRTHSEFQVTYQGKCHLEIFMDGAKIFHGWLPEHKVPQDGGYTTLKEYLPSGTNGNVLQWLQSAGDGEIVLFETDMTLADQEQPNISNPQ